MVNPLVISFCIVRSSQRIKSASYLTLGINLLFLPTPGTLCSGGLLATNRLFLNRSFTLVSFT